MKSWASRRKVADVRVSKSEWECFGFCFQGAQQPTFPFTDCTAAEFPLLSTL